MSSRWDPQVRQTIKVSLPGTLLCTLTTICYPVRSVTRLPCDFLTAVVLFAPLVTGLGQIAPQGRCSSREMLRELEAKRVIP